MTYLACGFQYAQYPTDISTALPGVTEVETVTGEYDLIVLITAPDAADLDRVLDTVAGWRETRRTTTWVVLKRYT